MPKEKTLLDKFLALQAKVRDMESPHEAPEEVEKKMMHVKSFFSDINAARDAVSAASLYNADFFKQQGLSHEFKKALLDFLLERFFKSSSIIEDNYNLWKNLREKI